MDANARKKVKVPAVASAQQAGQGRAGQEVELNAISNFDRAHFCCKWLNSYFACQ